MNRTPPAAILPLLQSIETGKLTPAAAFKAYADRIERLEPSIKAFAHLDVAGAAKAVAANATKPLKGLPIGIKDVLDTAEMPTAYGSPVYAGHRPATDAAIISMVRRAGGTIIGKTTTTPFAHLDPTATENPAALGHTPGGSSAGSAAAVSAGMVAFAVGTQTGGSVVRPASYCGIAGYKPSYRMLPTVGLKNFSWFLDTVGLFAPRVADVAFFAGALTGRQLSVAAGASAKPTLGLIEVPEWSLAEPAMHEAVMKVAKAAEQAGAKIVDLGANAVLQEAWHAHGAIQMHEAALALAFEYDRYGARLPPILKSELDQAQNIGISEYDEARAVTSRARREMKMIFGNVDALIQPAAPGAPPATLASTGRALFNRLWTLTGDPAISVPGMLSADGLPLGIQVIGPFGEDAKALQVAHFVEGVIDRVMMSDKD